MTQTPEPRAPSPQEHITGIWLGMFQSRCLLAAVELEIADVLANGPLQVEEIAQRTKTHAGSLFRLLRALETIGLFAQVSPRVFANSPSSEYLRKDVPGSQWAAIRFFAPGWGYYESWGSLTLTLRTGKTAFDQIHGFDTWEYYRRHPEQWEVFNEGMRSWMVAITPAITAAYDWSRHSVIVDVGGGIGSQLVDILDTHPACRGILFDQPQVVMDAIPHPRIETVGGDFFKGVPSGGECYILRMILHDWGDTESIEILKHVREAINPGGRVMILEQVIPDTPEFSIGKWLDLHMMVAVNGRERTAAEFSALLDKAGFELEQIVPTASPSSIVVGRLRD